MTQFLTLTNRVLRRLNEVEIAESDFASTRGVQSLAKDAVNASIQRINQAEFTWPFSASTGSQLLVAGQEDYSWPADFLVADWNSFFVVKDDALSESGHPLKYIPREVWIKQQKQDDDYSESDGLASPSTVFEAHTNGFAVSPSPNEAYTVTFDYWALATDLSAYSDEPTIPSAFDEVIIQGAIYHMYMWRDNSEQAQLADKRFQDQLSQMRTLLINKKDRVVGSFINRSNSSRTTVAIPVAGWYM